MRSWIITFAGGIYRSNNDNSDIMIEPRPRLPHTPMDNLNGSIRRLLRNTLYQLNLNDH